jgi:hypothetical protein
VLRRLLGVLEPTHTASAEDSTSQTEALAGPRWSFSALESQWLITALLFGAALGLTTLFSVDPHTSLWGSYERQQGLLSYGAYLLLFLLTAAKLRSRAHVVRLLTALVWGSAPIVAYDLRQAAGLDPLGWQTDAASPVLSTLGRANFLGSYLVLDHPNLHPEKQAALGGARGRLQEPRGRPCACQAYVPGSRVCLPLVLRGSP